MGGDKAFSRHLEQASRFPTAFFYCEAIPSCPAAPGPSPKSFSSSPGAPLGNGRGSEVSSEPFPGRKIPIWPFLIGEVLFSSTFPGRNILGATSFGIRNIFLKSSSIWRPYLGWFLVQDTLSLSPGHLRSGWGSSQQPKAWIFPALMPSSGGLERDEKGLEAKLVLFSWVI